MALFFALGSLMTKVWLAGQALILAKPNPRAIKSFRPFAECEAATYPQHCFFSRPFDWIVFLVVKNLTSTGEALMGTLLN